MYHKWYILLLLRLDFRLARPFYREEVDKMKLVTSNFGEINIPDDNIINFEKGIPGFEKHTKYVIINDEDKDSPFCWLQSIEDPDLAFTLVNPYLVYQGYDPKFSEGDIAKLGQAKPEDYSVLSIVIIPENIEEIRTNLMAPIVINLKTKKAGQIITEGDLYPVKYYIFKELQENKAK